MQLAAKLRRRVDGEEFRGLAQEWLNFSVFLLMRDILSFAALYYSICNTSCEVKYRYLYAQLTKSLSLRAKIFPRPLSVDPRPPAGPRRRLGDFSYEDGEEEVCSASAPSAIGSCGSLQLLATDRVLGNIHVKAW